MTLLPAPATAPDVHSCADAASAAADPSTPIPALLTLAEQHPDAVLRNPAFELSMVADPHLLSQASDAALAAMVDAARRYVDSPLSDPAQNAVAAMSWMITLAALAEAGLALREACLTSYQECVPNRPDLAYVKVSEVEFLAAAMSAFDAALAQATAPAGDGDGGRT